MMILSNCSENNLYNLLVDWTRSQEERRMGKMGKTSLGLEENIAGLLSYVLGWLTGLIFLLLEKRAIS